MSVDPGVENNSISIARQRFFSLEYYEAISNFMRCEFDWLPDEPTANLQQWDITNSRLSQTPRLEISTLVLLQLLKLTGAQPPSK
jgi:hypothetical protein